MNKMFNPNSYSPRITTQSRNEFLEKFRQQHQESSLIFSKNLRKSHTNTSDSRIFQVCGQQRRWEYLHKLDKLQRIQLDHQRQKKQREALEKESLECTFSPKLNTSTGNASRTRSSFFSHLQNSSPLRSSDKAGIRYDLATLLGRQAIWNQKMIMKIEGLKQNKLAKEYEECRFHPAINTQESLKKVALANPAKEILVDPDSYDMYVSRQNWKRENKRGMENLKVLCMKTEKYAKPLIPCCKPINLTKSYRPQCNAVTAQSRNAEQKNDSFNTMYYCSHKSRTKFEDPMHYENAKKALRLELHSIDLLG